MSRSAREVTTAPGVRLAVYEDGEPEGPAILFANSLAADHGMWDEVVARLSDTYRLIRYDARGHGRSTIATDYSLDALASDVGVIMTATTNGPVLLCGLSLGGLTAMRIGATMGDRLSGLILANTAASFPPASMWEGRANGARTSGMGQFVNPTLDRWLTQAFRDGHPERTADVARMIEATSADGYAGCCETLGGSDVLDELDEIYVPTLVIAGESDLSTPPERARELVAAIGGATYLALPAAHVSAIEAADEFTAAVHDFAQRRFA